MPVSEARRRVNDKWDRANMTVLGVRVTREYAAAVKEKAAAERTNVNAVVKQALDDFLSRDPD